MTLLLENITLLLPATLLLEKGIGNAREKGNGSTENAKGNGTETEKEIEIEIEIQDQDLLSKTSLTHGEIGSTNPAVSLPLLPQQPIQPLPPLSATPIHHPQIPIRTLGMEEEEE